MATKSNNKSKRGGKRPGAGRPPGSVKISEQERHDYRSIGIELGLAALEHALKAYPVPDDDWTLQDHRRHIAFLLLGVPPRTIAAMLFKPDTCDQFSSDLARAIKAVQADIVVQDATTKAAA
jgi:TPP-dependent pyruvate/acetoin dehydrogenase alpha subunit